MVGTAMNILTDPPFKISNTFSALNFGKNSQQAPDHKAQESILTIPCT